MHLFKKWTLRSAMFLSTAFVADVASAAVPLLKKQLMLVDEGDQRCEAGYWRPVCSDTNNEEVCFTHYVVSDERTLPFYSDSMLYWAFCVNGRVCMELFVCARPNEMCLSNSKRWSWSDNLMTHPIDCINEAPAVFQLHQEWMLPAMSCLEPVYLSVEPSTSSYSNAIQLFKLKTNIPVLKMFEKFPIKCSF